MSERLTVSAAARYAGCDEKQVRRAIDKGLLHKGEDGLIDTDQLDGSWRRVNRRTIARSASDKSQSVREISDNSDSSDIAEVVRDDETPAEAAERIITAGGSQLSIEEAVKRKENYLGLLKQLEYDQKSGAVVPVGDVTRMVGEEYAKVRTRLLAIPSERAPAVHRLKTPVEVEDLLRSVITEALEELTRDSVGLAA